MNKRMLIDTTHAEETRVVVMDGERLEDYDVETSSRKQLKGNIYLAKVIRVEPSLQAAFVEYGGNRHGFLAFSEIHPDYFQIPIADREKLLALQEEEVHAEELRQESGAPEGEDAESPREEGDADETRAEHGTPETVGGEHDTGDESLVARRTARFLRNYKIQEVIRRRQVLLVQVVKEERGNKGAALTTYISLAGRYCVLMPNALRGGGVSRKITSDSDRKRLRDIITGLDLPRGMAMIVRTAGSQRPGPEITRDCEYLLQLWDDIRSHTLSSVAPTLVYEEASLIKRAIRDLFSKDIEEIIIDGEPAWKNAREFMRLLMPHNVNKVKQWRDHTQTLFARNHVEGHLDAMFSPTAQLKSGGYLVINQTEALVAIDVNSGRSTSQRNIEETALRTNLEAADEVARQLRLRDLAGLVVIDFIDMESRKHNNMVEKRLKDALRSDRARIQIGNISHFGLLEMSRQRLRPSIAESVLSPCPHCQGTGFVRGTESAALHILRAIDDEGASQKAAEIEVHVASSAALYILNNKRAWLTEIEQRHRMHVVFQPDASLMPSEVRIERIRPQTAAAPLPQATLPIEVLSAPPIVEIADPNDVEIEAAASHPVEEAAQDDSPRRKRRRRRGRRDRRNDHPANAQDMVDATNEAPEDAVSEVAAEDGDEALIMPGRRRTRVRRMVRDDEVAVPDASPADESPAVEAVAEPSPTQAHDQRQGGRGYENNQGRRDRFRNDRNRDNRNRDDRQRNDRNHDDQQDVAPRTWTGPTPADPFGGGGFDIFDVIEQAENNHVTTPRAKPSVTPHHEAKQEAEVTEAPALIVSPAEPEAAPEPVQQAEVAKPDLPEADAPAPRRRGRPRKDAKAVVEEVPVAKPVAAPAKPRSRKKVAQLEVVQPEVVVADVIAPEEGRDEAVATVKAEKPKSQRGRPRKRAAVEAEAEAEAEPKPATKKPSRSVVTPIDVDEATPKRPRAGWWKR